uniref:ATP binding cassette subfamily C member 5 n=1 Tax=Sus scrofa TaxID=9823 RepID=A0A4X1USQ0_PIG
MKDIDIGKEYIIPSPGYRNVRERTSNSGQQRDREDSKYKRTQLLDCQDALETAARAEGLSLDASMHSQLRILDEEHPKGKYHHSLSALKPIRTTSKHQHPVDNAGLFSCMTFSWLSPLARIAHRKGELLMEDVWSLSKHESSEVNCRRLERLWQEELNEVGPDAASLRRVVWTFCRTRLILSIVCLMITQLAGFSGPLQLAWCCQNLDLGECLCSGTSDRSCSLEFSGWLYSAVRMRESSWAESLAKSSARSLFLENFLYCRLTATSGALTD